MGMGLEDASIRAGAGALGTRPPGILSRGSLCGPGAACWALCVLGPGVGRAVGSTRRPGVSLGRAGLVAGVPCAFTGVPAVGARGSRADGRSQMRRWPAEGIGDAAATWGVVGPAARDGGAERGGWGVG